MRPFCEIMVQDVFPAVRAILAQELTENLHHTQSEAAQRMGVTQPAISQYMRELRGKRVETIKSDAAVYGLILESARRVAKAETVRSPEIMCCICKKMRETGLLCKLHREAVPSLASCNACFEGLECK